MYSVRRSCRRLPTQVAERVRGGPEPGEPTWQLRIRGFNRAFALLLDLHAGEALGVVP